MSRTKKFKMTDLGPIPEDWEMERISDVCTDYAYGVGAEAVAFDGENKYLRITDIDDDSHEFVPSPLASPAFFSPCHIAKDGDLFVARTGASVGKSYLYKLKDGKLIYAGFLMKAHVRNACPQFVSYATQTASYKCWVESESARSGQPGINLQQLKTFQFPAPKDSEQRRIAAALSDADELIAALTELLEKKRNLKQGAMQQLLTGKRRLPGFKGKWGEKPLGDLLDYEQPQPYIVSNAEYDEDGIPVLTAGKSFVLGYTHDKTGVYSNLPVILFDDFLTISRFIAFPFKVKSSAVKMLHLKDERNSLAFIQMAMERLGYVPGDHQRHWISIFSKFQIPLPEPDEQHAITLMLTDMDEEIAGIEAELEKAKNVKTGMMQQLLTGKVRLEEA